MAYAITEYEFWGNPKVREAGKDAVLMYLAGNSYCNQFMTDGLITFAAIPTVATLAFQNNPDKAIKALIDNRLWLKDEKGYQVNDYLRYNKSKAQIEDLMKKRSAAGRTKASSRVLTNDRSNDGSNDGSNADQMIQQMPPSISFTISKDINTSTTTRARDEIAEIVTVYESEIGALTPIITEDILSVIDDYPLDWFAEAFREAARNNKRSWKYALAILKRWKADGFKVDNRQRKNASYGKRADMKPDIPGYVSDKSHEEVVYDD